MLGSIAVSITRSSLYVPAAFAASSCACRTPRICAAAAVSGAARTRAAASAALLAPRRPAPRARASAPAARRTPNG